METVEETRKLLPKQSFLRQEDAFVLITIACIVFSVPVSTLCGLSMDEVCCTAGRYPFCILPVLLVLGALLSGAYWMWLVKQQQQQRTHHDSADQTTIATKK